MAKAVAAMLAAFAAWAPLPGHAATPHRGVMDYKIYFGGFAVIALEIDVERARPEYRIGVDVRTIGVADQFFPWRMRAYSRGRLAGVEARPEATGSTSDWRGNKRLVDIHYDGGRPVVRRLLPRIEDEDHKRTPVADESLPGAIDLASAILSMTLAAERGQGCAGPLPVFDGRRRYDLVAERLGEERIRLIGHTAYDTAALKCRVSMVRLGGFRKRPEGEDADARRREAMVWVAGVGHGLPPAPVRIEVDTRWGKVIGHLVRVREEKTGAE